jgi:triacylglycerol lipase
VARGRGWAAIAILTIGAAFEAPGCAVPAATDCDLAVDAVERCYGTTLEERPFSAECRPAEAQHARAVMDELELSGCEGEAPPDLGKADLFCGASRWDPLGLCRNPPALGPEPEGDAARYPILLAHGFNTSTTNFWRFHDDIPSALIGDGHRVVLGHVPPFNTPAVRAEYLRAQVDELLAEGHERVNLVCFSQGGIDCRYLVSPQGLDYGEHVATVTTISAPHRGTAAADLAARVLRGAERVTPTSRAIVELLATGLGRAYSELGADTEFVDGLESMSEASMARFNLTILDHPAVEYESWASASYPAGLGASGWRERLERDCTDDEGVVRILTHRYERDVMFAPFVVMAPIVGHGAERLPHDGVATVQSAHWGRFRGCFPADHLDVVGQINDHPVNRLTGWDYVRFYRNIAFDLAARGY